MSAHSNAPTDTQVLERIAQLVANPRTDCAWVCSQCGYKIAAKAGFAIPARFANTCKVGTCEVCGQADRALNPSYDWMGLGD